MSCVPCKTGLGNGGATLRREVSIFPNWEILNETTESLKSSDTDQTYRFDLIFTKESASDTPLKSIYSDEYVFRNI